jgi:hypothetical protein
MASLRHIALVLPGLVGPAQPRDGRLPAGAGGLWDARKRGSRNQFFGRAGPADAMLHRFDLVFADTGVTMEGVVMLAGEPDRPWGIVMHDCPEGDATGAKSPPAPCGRGRSMPSMQGRCGMASGSRRQPGIGQRQAKACCCPISRRCDAVRGFAANQITSLPGDAFRLKACQE